MYINNNQIYCAWYLFSCCSLEIIVVNCLLCIFKAMIWLLLLSAVILICYFLLKKKYEHWEKREIPGPKPRFFVGNIGKSFIMKRNLSDIFEDIYNNYPDEPFVGVYRGGTPCLLVRDPEFIKNILVKNFKSFPDNDFHVDKKVDPLFGRNPFVLKGDEWKTTRAQLTPGFTSGKMKYIFPLMENVAQQMLKYMENQRKGASSIKLEAKELCTKFTINNVALCAFGIDGKCFDEENSEFRDMAQKFISPDTWQGIVITFITIMPELAKLFPIKLVRKDVEDKLINIIMETLKYRKENNVVRNDYLQFIAQLMDTTPNFTEIDVTAHAASFFGDGFETSSLVMSYVLFDLAMNPEVQDQLREEIASVEEKYNGVLSYEALQQMTYFDACINESMRIHPVVGILSKSCTQRYTYKSESNEFRSRSVTLEPGEIIVLPVGGLQKDSRYFPEPEKFMPERMLNKEDVNRYAFLPFGDGPRACLGQRFGVLQIKVAIACIIKNYKLTLNPQTQLPLVNIPWYFLNMAKGGLWLNFDMLFTNCTLL